MEVRMWIKSESTLIKVMKQLVFQSSLPSSKTDIVVGDWPLMEIVMRETLDWRELRCDPGGVRLRGGGLWLRSIVCVVGGGRVSLRRWRGEGESLPDA